MTRSVRASFARRALLVFVVVPVTVNAQGANVDVTVIPSASAGQAAPARDGFTVCVGTAANYALYGRQLTPFNGVANTAFKNLPVGQQAVIRVTKAGYVGVERTATLQADWNNHIQVAPQVGSGGPTCPTTSGTTPPPTAAPPPADVTLQIAVVSDVDGKPLRAAQVCIGPTASSPDRFATVKPTDASGNVAFSHLVVSASYRITAAKGGYSGRGVDYHPSAASHATVVRLTPGTGGATCPNMEISYDAVTSVSLPVARPTTTTTSAPPPPTTPARLGQETLAPHGQFPAGTGLVKTLDCKTFGADYVLTGLSGSSGLAVDQIGLGCSRVLSNGTLGANAWLNYFGNANLSLAFVSNCPTNQVVVGITGWIDANQVRGFQLRCRPITSTGLVTGSTTVLGRVGGNPGTAWGPDNCSNLRPARAMKVGLNTFATIPGLPGPQVVAGTQLICEQPPYQ